MSQLGIATRKSTPYHPIGNGQVERYNGIIWKTVRLSLKSKNLPESQWEVVLPNALHSIRSLLSTSTNTTPHERFFSFQRRSSCNANVWYTDGRESTVSLRDLAHCPSDPMDATKYSQADPSETVEANAPILTTDVHPDPEPWSPIPMRETRRSTHEIKPPSRYGW